MSVVVHPAGTSDVPAGEAVFLPAIPGQAAPDVAGYAEAGTLLLPYTEGNIATGDPVGDAYRLADLLDGLDLDRSPVPPIALRLDPEHTRENLATAMAYVTNWADAVNARGYAPWIESTPDVIWEAARNGAQFAGCLPIAFQPTDGPAPDDVTNVPGLPADTYPGGRAYIYGTNGETIAADGVLAKASVQLDPAAPAKDAPAAYGGSGNFPGLPAQADISQASEPAWASDLKAQLAEAVDLLAEAVDLLRELVQPNPVTPDPAASTGTDPGTAGDGPAAGVGQHTAPEGSPE